MQERVMVQGDAALAAPALPLATPAHTRSLWQRILRARYYYLLLTPCFALLILFNYYPAFLALYGSIFTIDYGREGKFVGLDNFREMWNDPTVREAVGNVVALTIFGAIAATTVPVIVASWIFRLKSQRAQYIYRIIMVWPAIIPGLVTLLLWQFIYDPNFGLLNYLLGLRIDLLFFDFSLESWQRAWLADPDIALYALMGSSFPFVGGIGVLIYLAGLQDIPSELFDAAELDGASGLRRFFTIDLPLIKGQIRLLLVLAVIDGLQAIVGPLVLTRGGPVDRTMVPGLYMYQEAFTYGRLGYAAAIGVVVFIAIFSLTLLNLTLFKDKD